MPRRYLAPLATLVLLSFIAGASRAEARRERTPATGLAPIAYGKPAPNFAFDSTTAPTSLRDLRGRPVVVNFWAAYCAPCIDELGAFAHMQKQYGSSVAFVAVSDQGHDITDDDLRAKGIAAISVADPERKIFGLYGVMPIPVTLVLAPDGTVVHVSVGELDWNELRTAIDAAGP